MFVKPLRTCMQCSNEFVFLNHLMDVNRGPIQGRILALVEHLAHKPLGLLRTRLLIDGRLQVGAADLGQITGLAPTAMEKEQACRRAGEVSHHRPCQDPSVLISSLGPQHSGTLKPAPSPPTLTHTIVHDQCAWVCSCAGHFISVNQQVQAASGRAVVTVTVCGVAVTVRVVTVTVRAACDRPCEMQPHLLSLSAAVCASTASTRLRAILRRMGTITVAVRNDVPAAMRAEIQAAFPGDQVLPRDLAAPLVLHAGRQREAADRRNSSSTSGNDWARARVDTRALRRLRRNLQRGHRGCCGGQQECSLILRRAVSLANPPPIVVLVVPCCCGSHKLQDCGVERCPGQLHSMVTVNATLACSTHKTKKTLMNSVMNTAIGSTQKTRLRAFCRLMTHVLTRKKMRADAQAVRMGLKNQDRMIGTTPCKQTANRWQNIRLKWLHGLRVGHQAPGWGGAVCYCFSSGCSGCAV